MMFGASEEYTGTESAVTLSTQAFDPNSVFEIRPGLQIPPEAAPMWDDETQAVVGYCVNRGGVFQYYDLDGNWVGIDELPLETPWLDPIDLIGVVGGLLRVFARGGIRLGPKMAQVVASKAAIRGVQATILARMRFAFTRLIGRQLQFTATTAKHMAQSERFVPVHILQLALKHGARKADGRALQGAFEYVIPMLRNGQGYTLKVVVREQDWTVLHFHYFR